MEHNNATTSTFSIDKGLYNLSMLEEMDDSEYIAEILVIFLKETPLQLKEMKEALHNRKFDIVNQKAHSIKGSAGVIQADRFTAYLHEIEMLGKAGTINDELTGLVENAGQHYKLIEQSLKKYIKELY